MIDCLRSLKVQVDSSMVATETVVLNLFSVFIIGFFIWHYRNIQPSFFKFTIFFFMFFFFQSSLVSLIKSLGYNFQLESSLQITFSIFLAWFTCLLNNNNQPTGKGRYYVDIVAELLQGDRATAIRLFDYNKEKFGGKTNDWIWQKVIRDIERDRR